MTDFLKKISLIPDKTDYKALLISFIIINFTFLFHSFNFMWGNHDVQFVKDELLLSSGLFEGRFTQFVPHRTLVNGQILPILNNLLGLSFLTLGLWTLAKYWKLPKNILNYTLFITFFATQPYTLSWLYFTFITLSCLLWVFLSILGLYICARINQSKNKILLSVIGILCFYLPLGGYPPVINTIFVCLSAKITLDYIFENKNLKTLFQTYIWTVINILIAAILFKLTLRFVNPDNVYNLETTRPEEMFSKFISTIIISCKQFTISLPFMEKSYKLTLLAMVLLSFISATIKAPNLIRKIMALLFICITVWCAALTTFLVTPHTEYVARIDFYGLAFIYAFAVHLLFSYKTPLLNSIGLLFMFILIPWNILNDIHAQKIWKQGFDSEFQILEDMYERIETHPQFDPNQKYKIYIAGDITLRPYYYHKKFEQNEPFLLSLPYLAIWQGGPLLEFYSPYDYIDYKNKLLPEDITPKIHDFIMKDAEPWPRKNALYIDSQTIFVIYNRYGLDELKSKLKYLDSIK